MRGKSAWARTRMHNTSEHATIYFRHVLTLQIPDRACPCLIYTREHAAFVFFSANNNENNSQVPRTAGTKRPPQSTLPRLPEIWHCSRLHPRAARVARIRGGSAKPLFASQDCTWTSYDVRSFRLAWQTALWRPGWRPDLMTALTHDLSSRSASRPAR